MKRTITIVLALFACGCGQLSNDFVYDGLGQVSGRLLVNGQPVIWNSSTGICQSAEQIPQGPPIVAATQIRVSGT